MKILFKEEQKFTQWWLWLVLLVSFVFPLGIILKEIYDGASLNILFISTPIPVVILLFLSMNLKTEISDSIIKMSYFPFLVKKNVKWEEVKTAKVVNYGFVGGWGIRLWTKYGTVYNVRGNKGLAIELNDGKKFLIGTQKPEELQKVIKGLLQEN